MTNPVITRSMNHQVQVGQYSLYGGMRLKQYTCDVFYDNPLFSELIYPNPGNQGGQKTWGRFVRQTGQPNPCFVPDQPGTPQDYDRLEREWQRDAHTDQTFDTLWGGWRDVHEHTDLPWLVVCPRDQILQYWYNISLEHWLTQIERLLQSRGDRYRLRLKRDRKYRMHDRDARVIHTAQNYRGIVTAHSVSAIDAVLAGRPAVIWGQDPTLGCGTPWTEFESTGQVREPLRDQTQKAACTWARTTYPTLDTERAVKCVMK